MLIEHRRGLSHATIVITEARVAIVVEILPQCAEHSRTVISRNYWKRVEKCSWTVANIYVQMFIWSLTNRVCAFSAVPGSFGTTPGWPSCSVPLAALSSPGPARPGCCRFGNWPAVCEAAPRWTSFAPVSICFYWTHRCCNHLRVRVGMTRMSR